MKIIKKMLGFQKAKKKELPNSNNRFLNITYFLFHGISYYLLEGNRSWTACTRLLFRKANIPGNASERKPHDRGRLRRGLETLFAQEGPWTIIVRDWLSRVPRKVTSGGHIEALNLNIEKNENEIWAETTPCERKVTMKPTKNSNLPRHK